MKKIIHQRPRITTLEAGFSERSLLNVCATD